MYRTYGQYVHRLVPLLITTLFERKPNPSWLGGQRTNYNNAWVKLSFIFIKTNSVWPECLQPRVKRVLSFWRFYPRNFIVITFIITLFSQPTSKDSALKLSTWSSTIVPIVNQSNILKWSIQKIVYSIELRLNVTNFRISMMLYQLPRNLIDVYYRYIHVLCQYTVQWKLKQKELRRLT